MQEHKQYFVSPDGKRLVEAVSKSAQPKPGWRVATQEDWDRFAAIEAERAKSEG